MPKHEPLKFSAADVLDKLRQTDRAPFIELLAGWLECTPDSDAVKAFAKRSPDKYIAAITQIARLSGYAEKHDHAHNHTHVVQNMSDSQLEDNLRQRMAALGLPMPDVIDIVATPVTEQSGATDSDINPIDSAPRGPNGPSSLANQGRTGPSVASVSPHRPGNKPSAFVPSVPMMSDAQAENWIEREQRERRERKGENG